MAKHIIVSIDEDTHKALRHYAIDNNTSLASIIRQAMDMFVKDHHVVVKAKLPKKGQ